MSDASMASHGPMPRGSTGSKRPRTGAPRRVALVGATLAIALAVFLLLRFGGRPIVDGREDGSSGSEAPAPRTIEGPAADSRELLPATRPREGRPSPPDLATAALAPSSPRTGGDVVVWIDAPADESLPFSLAVVLVPEAGYRVRVERDARSAAAFPVSWGVETSPPWVRFEDLDGKGRRLRFSGLSVGRWVAWVETRWERSAARFELGVPPPDAVYAEPVSFGVGASPSTVTLKPLAGGRSADVEVSLRAGRSTIPLAFEVRTSHARWVVGTASPSGEPGFALPVASWIPADEDVILTPVWTSVPTSSPLRSQTVRVSPDTTHAVEWVAEDAAVLEFAVPGSTGELATRRKFGLRVTPIASGRADEPSTVETWIEDGTLGPVLVPGRYRFELGLLGYGFDGAPFERAFEGPGPVAIAAPSVPTFGPVDVVVRERDGRTVTYRYQDGDLQRVDAEGKPQPVLWSQESPPLWRIFGGEAYLVATPADDEADPVFRRNDGSATRVAAPASGAASPIRLERPAAPTGPTGAVEVYVVDDDGHPVDGFRMFAESGKGEWGWLAAGHLGTGTFDGLPVGRHRLRVARESDGLFGLRAAVTVVNVKSDVETVAYVRLPAP